MENRKLTTDNLRRMALALQNSYEWQARLFAELIEEIDGGKVEQVTGKKKGKAPATEEMEEVESPFNEVEEAPKKGKKVKAAPVEEPVAEEPEEDMFADEAEAQDESPTLDEVRKVVKDFATKHGKEKALKLLGKFKVTAIPDIKKADYAKVIELAKKYL